MSSDKMISLFKNNWIWFLTMFVSGVIAWTLLKAQVEANTKDIEQMKPEIQFFKECVIEQKSLNKLLKRRKEYKGYENEVISLSK